MVPFVKQKVKEWKLKKQDAKAKKELDEKEGKDKATGDKKSEKPKELDSPLMNQAEIEATMAEYEVTILFCLHYEQMNAHQCARNIDKVKWSIRSVPYRRSFSRWHEVTRSISTPPRMGC